MVSIRLTGAKNN
ncbi:hypothetical protein GQ600_641 [Phytophthora cactorum]|nr:hypothetical protein GQ600_641 [Phytophthora cactorum]